MANHIRGIFKPRNTLSAQTPTISGRNGVYLEPHATRNRPAARRGLMMQSDVNSRSLQELEVPERRPSPKRTRREARSTSTIEDSPVLLDNSSEDEADVLAQNTMSRRKRRRTDSHAAGDTDGHGRQRSSQTANYRTGVDALMDSREYATRNQQEKLRQRPRKSDSIATAPMTETNQKDIVSTRRLDLGMPNRQLARRSSAGALISPRDEGTRQQFVLNYFYARGVQQDIDRLVLHADGRKRWLRYQNLGKDLNSSTDLDDVIKAIASISGSGKKIRFQQRGNEPFWVDLELGDFSDFEFFVDALERYQGFETQRRADKWLSNARERGETHAMTYHHSLDADLAESNQRQRQSARQPVLQESRAPRRKIFAKLEPDRVHNSRNSNEIFQTIQRDAPDRPAMHTTRRSTRSSGGVRMSLNMGDETPSRGLRNEEQLSPDDAAAVMAARHTDFGPKWKRPLVYPKDGKKRATVEYEDLLRLDDGEFLNDNIIGFYLRYLMNLIEQTRPSDAKRIYWFNSYFFEKLTDSPKTRGSINYDAVKRWTRDVDLFTYDYVVVPVNENAHWYLVLICNLPQLFRNKTEEYEEEAKPPGSSPRHPIGIEDSQEANRKSDANFIDSESRNDDRMDPPNGASSRHLQPTESSDPIVEVPASPDLRTELETNGVPTNDSFEVSGPSNLFSNATPPCGTATQGHLNSYGGSKLAQRRKKRSSIRQFDPLTPAVITLDSLDIRHPGTTRAIKEYLVQEANNKKGDAPFDVSSLQGMNAIGIPHQDNFCDCGPFLLAYMDKFTEDPTGFVSKLLRKDFEDSDWPTKLYPPQMRTNIRRLILRLYDGKRVGTRKSKEAPLPLASDPTNAEDNMMHGLRSAAEDEGDTASILPSPWKHVIKSSIEGSSEAHEQVVNSKGAKFSRKSDVHFTPTIDSTVIPDSQEGRRHTPPLPGGQITNASRRKLEDHFTDPVSSPPTLVKQLRQAAEVEESNNHILLDNGDNEP